MKSYLKVTVISKKGFISQNPLKYSEAHLIPALAENNKSLVVKAVECDRIEYERIFGG